MSRENCELDKFSQIQNFLGFFVSLWRELANLTSFDDFF